ncbi:winged helix-turn-helix transcriptional regulator [Actinomadura kijaniata]|uniref:winged helix-turn-helix transcriptional regulator n=1 Tax=Actinomadura kijaniata TaxID=46161 RepID=UPI003F1CECB5
MALGKDYTRQVCSLARALEVVGERWTLLIIRDAFYGVRRFSHFQAHLDIPRAVLAARLGALVEAGVLDKHDGEYVLTDTGRELWPAVHALSDWGARHFSDAGPCRLFRHVGCGGLVGVGGRCSSCTEVPPPTDLEIHPGPALDGDRRDDPVSLALRTPHRLLDPIRP